MIKISSQELRVLAEYIHAKSGIVLDDGKAYLLESRFAPLLEELGCANYGELYAKVRKDISGGLTERLIDAITTRETYFFRDKKPFELLQFKLLPDIFDRLEGCPSYKKNIAVWSAACATGQEVYTIAIILKELLGSDTEQYRIRILGTDIADTAITVAGQGRYTNFEVNRGLPADLLHKYFTRQDNLWTINEELRSMACFEKLNLQKGFDWLGKFDVVLCRNVAIYFNLESRKKLYGRIVEQLKPDGALLIGSTESLYGVSDRFERLEHHNTTHYRLI